jgi:hypothetical protein
MYREINQIKREAEFFSILSDNLFMYEPDGERIASYREKASNEVDAKYPREPLE